MKRGSIQLKLDVLRAIETERKPTWIMYTSKISWIPLQAILKDLLENDLIQASRPDRRDRRRNVEYVLTTRGHEALDEYDRITRFLGGL